MPEDELNNGNGEQELLSGKKAKRLPAFAAALLKRFNERDGRKSKDNNTQQQQTEAAAMPNEQDNNAAAAATTTIDGNDNEPKQDKQLVYAELVLKPAQETAANATAKATATATAAATTPVDPATKSATEYAEIVYVQKGDAKK